MDHFSGICAGLVGAGYVVPFGKAIFLVAFLIMVAAAATVGQLFPRHRRAIGMGVSLVAVVVLGLTALVVNQFIVIEDEDTFDVAKLGGLITGAMLAFIGIMLLRYETMKKAGWWK